MFDTLKDWYYIDCLFDSFKIQMEIAEKMESIYDIDGCSKLDSDDNLFKTFYNVCEQISNENSYNGKSKLLQDFFIKGTNNNVFEGNIYLWFKMLLPMTTRKVYHLQNKQLIKIFSSVFQTSSKDMKIDLEEGDVSDTICKYFKISNSVKPKLTNKLTMQEVDGFLDKLSKLTKEDEQTDAFLQFCTNCTTNDLNMVIRLIKQDLKINAGPRYILEALGPESYPTFQLTHNLKMVIEKFYPTIASNKIKISNTKNEMKSSKSGVKIMCPISPMLAQACKSVEQAIKKNPEGMYSEIKYDGERVQIHKSGSEFKFFSRSLKPVLESKITHCKEFIPKAFPNCGDIILDSEIIVINIETSALLPFGTLGVHKREKLSNSQVCLFIFDCIYFNGEDLTKRPLIERKKILENNIKPVKNHVELSEFVLIKTKKELEIMTAKVLNAGLEGLVLKNIKSLYEPGKRGWLKIKKDYLFEGQIADTADLVVLGGWNGSGSKSGMLSIFLMGTFDVNKKLWKSVTKVHNGLNDSQLEYLQDHLKPLLIRSNPKSLPVWLECKRQLIPDFICREPKEMPVWEIIGNEFTKSDSGISIRFPRITRFREDKSSVEATTLQELEILYVKSRECTDAGALFENVRNDMDDYKNISIKTKLFGRDNSKNEVEKNENYSVINEKMNEDGIKNTTHESGKRKSEKQNEKNKKRKTEFNSKISNPYEDYCRPIKSNGIFKNITMYVLPHDFSEKYAKLISTNGGIISENSQTAKYAIHFSYKNLDDHEELRRKYNPHCRHLNFKWLDSSIRQNKVIENYQDFAVSI